MKFRRTVAALLTIGAFLAAIYIGLTSGSLPGAADAPALGKALGPLSLIPPLLAVALAFLLKDVIVSLLLGFLSGAALLSAVSAPGQNLWQGAVGSFTNFCGGIVATAADRDKCAVLILCLVIGGMVEVIRASGGFEALALRLIRHVNSPRKANLVGELLGVLVFFDDYANALIIGPVLQPVTDRLGVSREKLTYLVDSTAAPVTGIAVISSWVAVEVSVIEEGLSLAGLSMSGYSVFLRSIPYCFYCILCLALIFESSLMKREFGPMLQSEIRARGGEPRRGDRSRASDETPPPAHRQGRRILVAVLPIVLLCVSAFVSFYVSGRAAAVAAGDLAFDAPFTLSNAAVAFGRADTLFLVMCAAILSSATAIGFSAAFGLRSMAEGIHLWLKGASTLLPTVFILVLAWSLADTVEQLGTVYYVVELISLNVAWWLIPALIFAICCAVSFAAGSYGCMFLVMPMAIPIARTVMESAALPDPDAFFLLCVGSVLSGSIFGDHCSPLTDCTILSSMGCGCENMDHVRTQMPYALTTAAASLALGILPAALGLSVWLCLPLGCAGLAAVLWLFGRDPDREYQKQQHSDNRSN